MELDLNLNLNLILRLIVRVQFQLCLALYLTLTWTWSASAFNVDIPSVLTHHGPPGSMFGFSVAQHRDSNVSWILVGAPEADSRQPGIQKAGAVFRCSCVSSDTCQLVPFDRTGNNLVDGHQVDEKSGQWFGATVKSSGDDGIILACAPRYTWFSTKKKRRDPVGTCFIAKDSFTEFVEYSPCRTARWGYHRQGSCQLGLGADLDAAGRRSFLGAVGSWYWQGQVFMVDSRKSESSGQTGQDQSKVPFYQFPPPGQVYSQSTVSRPDIRWTKEGPSWDDDSYLGYSVVAGEFNGDSDSDVAVGMPRGANLTGKVVIYSSDLTNLYNVTGEQVGAYFGYSLCVLDTDGDGLDDIVIGAPMFTDYNDAAMKIETGRVYVVYQNTRKKKFTKWDYIDGTANLGRFGLSLCSLGDINRDNYGDFAVGAPYDGPNGRGAVYIYQGTKDGVKREYTQVIYGSALQTGVTTFGFSLSGGKDLDGNGYPDLLVGAYDSDSVSYFRSRPVVRVRNKLTFTSGKLISLDNKKCSLRDGTLVACLPLSLCMSYDGYGADMVTDFNVQYILDSKKGKEPRMFFLNREGTHIMNSTIRLRKDAQQCVDTQVYILSQIRDKLTPFEAELKYSMVETRVRRHLVPIVDVTSSTTEKDSLSIQKNCGPDNVCIPDLRLRVTPSVKSFVMGSTERIWIEVEVHNNREDSFESMLYVQVPQGLTFVNIERLDNRKDVPIQCYPPTSSSNNTLKCDIGNPLPTFAKVRFRTFFQPKTTGSDVKSSYDFVIIVNSTNPEDNQHRLDNYKPISVPIRIETKVEVYGFSRPQPIHYKPKSYKVDPMLAINESDIGPDVTHSYEIKCGGPSNIEEASVVILWPSFTSDEKHFLYLLEQPLVEGPGTCDTVGQANSLNLKIHGETRLISTTTISEGEGRKGLGNYSHSHEYSSNGLTYTRSYQNYTEKTFTRKTSGGSSSSDNNFSSGNTSHYSSSSSSGSSNALETPLTRVKRGAYEEELECDEGFRCIQIHCRVGPLTTAANTNVFIHLRGRVYADTLKSDKFQGKNVSVKSKLVSRVTILPYNVDPSFLAYNKVEIITKIEEEPDLTVPSAIPWWIYLAAILAGILLLFLLILLLYKCGFFKRRRPNTTPEGQPLHRNGYRD